MTYESEVLADSPDAWWRQGDTTSAMLDASGNGRDGAHAFGIPPATVASLVPTDTTFASAWPSDGSKEAVVTSASWMNTPTVTVEMWYCPGTVSGGRWLVGRDNNGADLAWRLDTDGPHVRWIFNVGGYKIAQANDVLTIGTPVYLRVTFDGTAGKLYVNNVLVATQAATGSLPSTTREIRLGRASDGLFRTGGDIDEVAVYGYPLSEARGTAHYTAGTLSSGESLDATLAATAPRPVSTITMLVPPLINIAATAPRPVAAGALVVPAEIAFTSVAQRPVADLAGFVPSQMRIAGTAPAPVATFTALVEIPIVPAPVVEGGASVVVAQAFGPVTMQGTQPTYSVSEAAIPRARQRIIVDGVDVTYFRDVVTPAVTYTLLEPLLYGPATLDVPQVAACFERLGVGDRSWLRKGAAVEVQRVLDDEVVATDWRGFIVAFDTSGRTLSVELGGEANGRAALRNRQVPIFSRINDIGHQIADSILDLRLPFEPRLGPETGIVAMTTGGTGHLDHIQNLVAKAWTRAGRQWTVMPDERTGVYELHRKNDTSIDGTVFIDDARTVANLRRDIAEEPNRIYPTAVTPSGQRVRFGVYPGLIQGRAPAFPGHMEQGDTSPGVRLLILKLQAIGYLKLEDAGGGFDNDVRKAVVELQLDAGLFDDGLGSTSPGEVNLATWRALYDLDVTGLSAETAHIEPAAQRRKVREWNRSGSGNIMGPNPAFDPDTIPVDRNIDMGAAGLNRSQVREFAQTELADSNDDNWVGSITFGMGGLVRGDGFVGMTMTSEKVMDGREVRPGMNLDLPQFAGGIRVHVAACEVDAQGIVTATVDTRFRDAMEVWEVMARNVESRRDPARSRQRSHRASTITKDSIGEWDEIGGLLGNDVELDAGWNVFPVVAAMEGTIRDFKIHTTPATEFVTAVFGESIGTGTLQALIGNPLTKKGARRWQREAVRQELEREYELLYVAGDNEQPCGYWPKDKLAQADDPDPTTDDETEGDAPPPIEGSPEPFVQAPLTGKWEDGAAFGYRSRVKHMVWVAVWSDRSSKIEAGRIMWPQLEAGV